MSLSIGELTSPQHDFVLSIQNIAYEEAENRPLVHLFCRNNDREFVHLEIFGHYPSFYVKEDEWTDRLQNHPTVKETSKGHTSLHGHELRKVYMTQPTHVADFRERFSQTWEADVFYATRFLIDNGLFTVVEFDEDDIHERITENHYRLHYTDIQPCDNHEDEYVEPRIGTLDIEVAAKDGFPEPEDAEEPVTTVVAHDSYTDEYTSWALQTDEWNDDVDLGDTRVFETEKGLLQDVNTYLSQTQFDVLTGWASNGFDYPYLIQRCRNLSVWSYYDWSPIENVYVSGRGEPVVDGVTCLDMLDGYEKTQMGTLKKATLEYVATQELGEGKVPHVDDVPEDENEYLWMWQHEIEQFMEYNHRDVEAVVEIDKEVGVMELFINLRQLVGCQFDSCDPNVSLLDVMFLREAYEQNIVLPTATESDVGDFHGAWVKSPISGLHEHTIYPDLSSLYPNLILQCNISPETIVGTEADLQESKYDKDDCVYSYIDVTNPPEQKSDMDPVYEKCYFLDHNVKSGFVSDVVKKILRLNDIYKGTSLYGSSKQIRNSVWGYLSDSDSFGKGTRLFDWRMGEAITLGGRKVIQYSAEEFIGYLNDEYDVGAYVFGGDTDSVMTSLPNVDDGETALDISMDAAEYLNHSYESFVEDTFGTTKNMMEIEIESYGSACFYPEDLKDGGGIKKRYAQLIHWDDDDYWLDESELKIKGFDYVRGDTANVTASLQYDVLEIILDDEENKRDRVVEQVRETVDSIRSGDIPISEYGIPFGIGQSLTEYGSVDRTPMPKYRGAKYANEYIYETNAIQEGDKPLYFYVSRVSGSEYPKRYTATTAEDGDTVDAVSVLEADDLPDCFEVDTEKMIQKTVVDPLERIFVAMGWHVDDVLVDSDQSDLASFM